MCFLAQNNIVSGIFASNLLRLKNHQLFRELLDKKEVWFSRRLIGNKYNRKQEGSSSQIFRNLCRTLAWTVTE